MQNRRLGRQIAHGNTSDIYLWDDAAVLKLLRRDIPPKWAAEEASITDAVHQAGVPAPRVLDMVIIAGRPGIVFEHIDGPSMWEVMLGEPERLPELACLLSELQGKINATPAPRGLPQLVARLAERIEQARGLSEDEIARVERSLEAAPRGASVCHFDIHPKNVVMASAGPMAVDWFDAAAGHPAADVVRSTLLMHPDVLTGHLDRSTPEILGTLHDAYLDHSMRNRGMSSASLLAWEQVVLASHLAEPLPEDEIAATIARLRNIQSGGNHKGLAWHLARRASTA